MQIGIEECKNSGGPFHKGPPLCGRGGARKLGTKGTAEENWTGKMQVHPPFFGGGGWNFVPPVWKEVFPFPSNVTVRQKNGWFLSEIDPLEDGDGGCPGDIPPLPPADHGSARDPVRGELGAAFTVPGGLLAYKPSSNHSQECKSPIRLITK